MKKLMMVVLMVSLLTACASVGPVSDYGVAPTAASTPKPLCQGGSNNSQQALGCLSVMSEQAIIHAAQQ